MVDIQYPMAEIRRGKKKKEETTGQNIMCASTMQGGHNKGCHSVQRSVGGMLISLCEAIEARDRYTRTSMIPDLPSQTALPLPIGC